MRRRAPGEAARARLGAALQTTLFGVGTAALLAAGPASARELWRRGDLALELTGSVREVLVATRGTDREDFEEALAATLPAPVCVRADRFADCPAFGEVGERDTWQSLTRVRTRLDAELGHGLELAVAYDHELLTGILDTFEGDLGAALAGTQWLDLDRDIHVLGLRDDSRHARWRHLLYRAELHLETRRLDLRVGRQRIAWGVGRIWTPMDRFNEIPPLAIEADQSPGVDALDLRLNLSGFQFVEAVYAPADRWRDASGALRFHGVVRDADVSLMAGIFEQARVAGVDAAFNLLDAAVRLEVVYTSPRRDVWPVGDAAPSELDAFVQAVASFDTNLDVGTGLYLLVEHLYDGNALGFGRGRAGALLPLFESTTEPPAPVLGALGGPFVRPASLDRFGSSLVISGARHQTALELGYDLTPALRGDLLALVDWNGGSAALAPTLSYTGFSSLELTAGFQVFSGPRRSQYGDAEPLAFAYAEWFF